MGLLDTILGKQTATESTDTFQPQGKKILIVEDDTYLLDFYVELLKGEGYEVFSASDGDKGLEITMQQKPDLIVTDLMMPIMDGKQMLQKIRAIDEFKTIPVIVLTNAATIDNVNATKEHASDFLIKSNVKPEEIIEKIRNLLV